MKKISFINIIFYILFNYRIIINQKQMWQTVLEVQEPQFDVIQI
jgi:hypothetical protein